jgi:acyl-CoA reductase-like NAD-dependent aldehyde dehydrogenase
MTRLDVRKTHKLYINGEFPRSESGRTFPAHDGEGHVIARMAEGSRKDLRDAVRAARNAQESWAARSGYNRGQILYRVAEMMEDRTEAFQDDMRAVGASKRAAQREVEASIDRLVWYAGWCDKFSQVYGNLNPVSGPFFNISSPEPTGVVGIVAPTEPPLLGLVSRVAPALVPGNTVVVIASDRAPVVAVTFAEALATSDVPPGVVNLLTGHAVELTPWLASHMDVNAIDLTGAPEDILGAAESAAADNVKRVVRSLTPDSQSPLLIAAFTETKTVWHPKGQ